MSPEDKIITADELREHLRENGIYALLSDPGSVCGARAFSASVVTNGQ